MLRLLVRVTAHIQGGQLSRTTRHQRPPQPDHNKEPQSQRRGPRRCTSQCTEAFPRYLSHGSNNFPDEASKQPLLITIKRFSSGLWVETRARAQFLTNAEPTVTCDVFKAPVSGGFY